MAFLDALLDMLERGVLLSLVAAGHKLVEFAPRVARIKEQVAVMFANSPLSESELRRQVHDAFYTLLKADGIPLTAKTPNVGNVLHIRGKLNKHESICLWLGFLWEQSHCAEGLWQMYVDWVQETDHGRGGHAALLDPLPALPEDIDSVFGNPRGRRDDVSTYGDRELSLANAARRRVGKYPLSRKDIPKLIAWVLATKVAGEGPDDAALDLDETTEKVLIYLRRASNTLLYQVMADIDRA